MVAAMRTVLALLLVACSAPATSPAPVAPATPPATSPAPTAAADPAPPPPAPARAGLSYPPAHTGDVVETHHGVAVADPYRWLEDMGSAETRQWVSAENAVTDAYLAGLPGRDALRQRIGELISYESYGVPQRHGAHYFWTHRDGKQSQAVLFAASGLDAAPRVLIDPNTISTDG